MLLCSAATQTAEASGGQPALSMEAVAKHTAEGGQGAELKSALAPPSVISRANRASLAGKGKAESHQTLTTKQQLASDTVGSQVGC